MTIDPKVRQQLGEYRQSIDNIDAALVHMLAERFRCTQAVGVLKATHELPPADSPAAARNWYARGQNFVMSYTEAVPGTVILVKPVPNPRGPLVKILAGAAIGLVVLAVGLFALTRPKAEPTPAPKATPDGGMKEWKRG